jgi:predicted Rossmann fold flavoprotein
VAVAYDVIVLGAGAAGLMCALSTSTRGRKVLLLEHLNEAGAKISISGGGRCNFTNLRVAPEHFHSANPHFCKSALSRYTQHDFIAMVERHSIAYHEKTRGQLFCDGSARQIVAMLLRECAAWQVDLRVAHRIMEVSRADRFRVTTDRGVFEARALVIATGGPSIPKMGATGYAYELARRFGLDVIEPRPALVPLKMGGATLGLCRSLAGVALEASVTYRGEHFRGSVLFTHRGLSGPAILQISSYWRGGPITIDLLPEIDARSFLRERKRSRPRAELKTVLAEIMPSRVAEALAAGNGSCAGGIANQAEIVLVALAGRLKQWTVEPAGSEGWDKAEVTTGGIDTSALSSRTMEARAVPGLYVIGEAVDVTGWLGGYNFQWAWSSGWCAGQAI